MEADVFKRPSSIVFIKSMQAPHTSFCNGQTGPVSIRRCLREKSKGCTLRSGGSRSSKTAGNNLAASTAAVSQPVFDNLVPGTSDQNAFTSGATGVLSLGVMNVADVAVFDAARLRDRARPFESRSWGARLIGQFEVRMKRREMKRHRIAQVFRDPIT